MFFEIGAARTACIKTCRYAVNMISKPVEG
jgi:hypothetical protein